MAHQVEDPEPAAGQVWRCEGYAAQIVEVADRLDDTGAIADRTVMIRGEDGRPLAMSLRRFRQGFRPVWRPQAHVDVMHMRFG